MSLTAGVRLGPYEIVSPLGAGGMGEVYRANDTRLDRAVALKVLPPHLSIDAQLRQRFEREARAISALNHPNICALFDVGEAAVAAGPEPVRFLVMELVEGETLAARLAKGPLPLDQALQRGIELADALSTAHRQGIVHRDFKPGNIVLTRAGAKLLDFGLAKASPGIIGAGPIGSTALPTTPPELTAQGTILGTFQYMAPEQIEGLDADARADIFAFGAVLFEMITGRRAFAGRSQASLIGAILKDRPPAISSIAPVAPAALDRVIEKCLAKDPEDRWQDARDLRNELRWIAGGGSSAVVPAATKSRAREWAAWALLAMALVAAGVLAVPYFRAAPSPAPVLRFTIAPPEGVAFAPAAAPIAPFPAVSPDGKRLAFVANRRGETPSIWVRSLESLDTRQLDGTAVRADSLSPALPFWSPDSRFVGFFGDGKLKRVDLEGGSPLTICAAEQSGGASWSPDGIIVFASKIDDGLMRVDANGGVPVRVTTPDRAKGELSHSNPAFLPDGRHFLFWVRSARPSIRIGSLDSAETRPLFEADSRAAYSSGYVLYVRQGMLLARPFDTARLETIGEPLRVAEDARTFALNGRSAFSVSNDVLVYRPPESRSGRSFAWHDRSGQQVGNLPDVASAASSVGLAGGEQQLIATIAENGESDLWLIDVARGIRSRVTSDPKNASAPIVSPDGRMVVFASDRAGVGDLYRKRTDGTGDDEVVVTSSLRKIASDWSKHWITFHVIDPAQKEDIWVLPEGGEAKPYLQTPFRERAARLSPDEKWMLYVSDEAGHDAVYVRPFPDANGGKWRVSGGGGGIAAKWRADGKEILYLEENGQVMAVPVTLGSAPDLGVPSLLFKAADTSGGFVPSRDGTRFLIPVGGQSRRDVPLTVLVNWPSLFHK